MTTETPGADISGPGGTQTLEAVTAERSSLLRDPTFAAAAVNPRSQEFAKLTKLNEAIAAGMDAAEAEADEAELSRHNEKSRDALSDETEYPADFLKPPDSPSGYELPTHQAKQMGLETNPDAEIELRQGFYAAGVDKTMASFLYTAAMTAASKPPTEIELAGQYATSERDLRQRWGKAFDANVALANAEARRVFEKMPKSITGGLDYATFCRASGMANNRAIVLQFFERARARQKAGG